MKIEDLGMYDGFNLFMVDEITSTNDYLKLNYDSFPDNSILWAFLILLQVYSLASSE